MEINEFEAGMLDAVLEAFAGADQLTQAQILELFGGDEELAAAVIDILVDVGLINKTGPETPGGLPAFITRNKNAVAFLNDGGFTGQLSIKEQPTTNVHATEAEITQVTESQDFLFDKASIETETQEVADENPAPDPPLVAISQTSDTESEIPAEDAGIASPAAGVPKQSKEVIFEVEFPNADEPFVQSEIAFQPSDQEDVPEVAESVVEQPDEPAVSIGQRPVSKASTENQFIDEPLPNQETEKPEPFVPTPEMNMPPLSDAAVLQQEIDQLRKEQLLAERKVREKDAMIHTLASHNEQLGRLRIFIWVLLGLIALLVIGLIIRSH